MFNDERHNRILEIIESDGRVEVSKLSEIFDVSLDTVRRDLKKLEEEGLLKRTHGGAVRIKPVGDAYDYETRKRLYSKEKMAIAKRASEYIENHDTLLIDGSTTISALVPYLGAYEGLKVFTNNIQVATDIIRNHKHIKVFMIGGLLDVEHGSSLSHDAVAFIKKLHVNKVFIGSCAISHDRGLSASEIEDAAIKRAMLQAGEQVFILADHTKFTRESLLKIADVSKDYTIITDRKSEEDHLAEIDALVEHGMNLIMVE